RINLAGEANGLLDGFPALAGKSKNESTMDGDTQFMAILGEAAGDVDAHALADVMQNLLIAAFVADQQQPQAIVAHDFQCVARNVGLGVAGPDHSELAELARDRFGPRTVVREGVVIEEKFLHLRKSLLGPAHFLDHVADAARPVAMTADRLRPQTEGAARFTAAPGIERDVRMLQITDKIILDGEIALVNRRYERQFVHVLQNGARR